MQNGACQALPVPEGPGSSPAGAERLIVRFLSIHA